MNEDHDNHSALQWVSRLRNLHDAEPDLTRSNRATPDRRDGAVYVMDEDLTLAVDVALATQRPFLLRGEPGSGKSSLAAFIARNLNWRYYEHVVTARAQARDLLYTFDSVRKLADASGVHARASAIDDCRYTEPGVLWWAFDRESAARRGAKSTQAPRAAVEPNADLNVERSPVGAVVLVDEIDKADPDFPNGLLVPLGSGEFNIQETGVLVKNTEPDSVDDTGGLLVVITTNEERDLPPAFLRRCVVYRLAPPNTERLAEIGRRHLAVIGTDARGRDAELLRGLASRLEALRDAAATAGRRKPSTAEYLDALHACRRLNVGLNDRTWHKLERLVLSKQDEQDTGV